LKIAEVPGELGGLTRWWAYAHTACPQRRRRR